MRYKLVVIPFMSRVHCTLTSIPPPYGDQPRVWFWDIGVEDVKHPEELYEVLSYIAGDIAASSS
jgi:hypothetical protein